VLLAFFQLPDQVGRRRQVADSPSVHGMPLGEGIQSDGPFLHSGEGANAHVLAGLINNFFVDFIGNDQEIILYGHLGEGLKAGSIQHRPRRMWGLLIRMALLRGVMQAFRDSRLIWNP